AASTRTQRQGVLLQNLGPTRRHVYRDQYTERLHEDLSSTGIRQVSAAWRRIAMHLKRHRRVLVLALAIGLTGAGVLATPFATVGIAQSNQLATDGARLMRGAVDLHYHVDPGYGVYENLAQAKAAGVRALLLKNHYEPTAALVMLLRPQF